ncbi:MAG: helix-turn-helix domain-containing protein [Dysgonamonadaceae bacterium]|jgi:transcriptional regulator with XRE-family HTH domain|nr:helix-turn-helix domain-containing protein [Dysgonamonadaceae bacterium]
MNLQSQIVQKVRNLRKIKGLSQPQMAELLHVDKSVYARLESGETYSWAKYLEELLQIFEITPEKFFEDIGSNVIINTNSPNGSNSLNVLNQYQESREVYEKLLSAKDEQIVLLKSLLENKL